MPIAEREAAVFLREKSEFGRDIPTTATSAAPVVSFNFAYLSAIMAGASQAADD
jgi:hypothetical protein